MTTVILRPVTAWSDFGHSEIEERSARVFSPLESVQQHDTFSYARSDRQALGQALAGMLVTRQFWQRNDWWSDEEMNETNWNRDCQHNFHLCKCGRCAKRVRAGH